MTTHASYVGAAFRARILAAVRELRATQPGQPEPHHPNPHRPEPGVPSPEMPDFPRRSDPEMPEPRRYPIHPNIPEQPIHEPIEEPSHTPVEGP